jgi:hypothetical protein
MTNNRKPSQPSRKKSLENFLLAILPPPKFDLLFENHLSLILIRPMTKAGQQWIDENVGDDETQHFGNAVICEPRFAEPIFYGAQRDGLRVSA